MVPVHAPVEQEGSGGVKKYVKRVKTWFKNLSGSREPVEPEAAKTRHHIRPSKSEPMLEAGTMIQGRFEVTGLIGAGGYGQILKATWSSRKIDVAVKIMTRVYEPKRMILEQVILRKLKGKPYFPDLYASGNHEGYMYIVMELLGPSLTGLRKKQHGYRFDAQTALRIGLQVISALETLHRAGYVHRDVKPGNLCTGKESPKSIYVVDFGLARLYKGVKARQRTGFRGTVRYASIKAHERADQMPFDDLISLFYTIIELSEGSLPWVSTRDHSEIYAKKRAATAEDLCVVQPPSLFEYYVYCTSSEYDESEAYDKLKSIVTQCLPSEVDLTNTPMSYELAPGQDKDITLTGSLTLSPSGSKERVSSPLSVLAPSPP